MLFGEQVCPLPHFQQRYLRSLPASFTTSCRPLEQTSGTIGRDDNRPTVLYTCGQVLTPRAPTCMATLRTLATLANGLYCDEETGVQYRRDDFLARIPCNVLESTIRLEKRAPGVYAVGVGGDEPHRFELLSRRRRPRDPVHIELPSQ